MKRQQKNTIKKSIFPFIIFIAICVSGANAETDCIDTLVRLEAKQGFIGAPTRVKVELLSEPPEISEEQMRKREEYFSKMKHVPDGGKPTAGKLDDVNKLPVTKQSIKNNVPETSIIFQDQSTLDNPPSAAPGSFVFFENNDIGTAGAPLNQRSRINEPSVGNNGRCVFYSGNWYASLSVDAGKTFQYINPYTAFGWPVGQNFCCDQVVIYDPGRDCLFWLLQSTKDSHTNNIHKLAVANSFSDIENQIWYTYDITAQNFSGADGSWLDFPDLVLGENYLYHTANYIGPNSSAFIARYSLDELAAGTSIGYNYVAQQPKQWVYRATHGAGTSMFWAAHNSTNSIRIYKWNEVSTGLSVVNRSVTPWYNGTRHAAGPDGKEWLNHFPSGGGYVLGAWYSQGVIGFMWCAAQDSSHPYPFVRVAKFNASDRTLISQPDIWNGSYAWAFPSINVNGRGHIAGSLMWGGGTYYPSCTVVIKDDYTSGNWDAYTSASGTSGPNIDRSGDYLTTRICYPYENTWMGTAFTLQGGGGNANAVPRFLWYGRERDRPLYNLANDTPVTFSQIPKDFTFKTVSYDWCGIAINPSVNHNLKADDNDFRFKNVYRSSTYSGTTRDFIVTDGHDYGYSTLYAKTYYGSDSSYTIEAEWEAYDLKDGKSHSDSIGSGEVIQMYEANLVAGNTYKVSLDITSGTADLAMFGYEASRSSGSRANRDWVASAAGSGGDENVIFTAQSTGPHGIAVVNDNANAANYIISVRHWVEVISPEWKLKNKKKGVLKGKEIDPRLYSYLTNGYGIGLWNLSTDANVDGPRQLTAKNKKETVWVFKDKADKTAKIVYSEKYKKKKDIYKTKLKYVLQGGIPESNQVYMTPLE